MLKASDVMTHALATCAPDTNVSQVAAIMRDRDIGNVLVVEDGELRGIVTDRDLALQGMMGEEDPRLAPVSRFMTTKVVTGQAEWSLREVAEMMAKHQIRRLPIVQNKKLVGIVSLGDVALHEDQQDTVKKSLQAISTPLRVAVSRQSGRAGTWLGLLLTILGTGLMAWLAWNQSGKALLKQMVKSELYHSAQSAVSAALSKVDDAGSSKSVRDFRHLMRSNLDDLTAQMPKIEYKAPKRKFSLFG